MPVREFLHRTGFAYEHVRVIVVKPQMGTPWAATVGEAGLSSISSIKATIAVFSYDDLEVVFMQTPFEPSHGGARINGRTRGSIDHVRNVKRRAIPQYYHGRICYHRNLIEPYYCNSDAARHRFGHLIVR